MDKGKRFNVRVNISIENNEYCSERLTINDEFTIPQKEFMDVCKILWEFQSLAKNIKERG